MTSWVGSRCFTRMNGELSVVTTLVRLKRTLRAKCSTSLMGLAVMAVMGKDKVRTTSMFLANFVVTDEEVNNCIRRSNMA